MPKLDAPAVRGFSRESRWVTGGFGALGCITSLMNNVHGSIAVGVLAAAGFAGIAVVGYRYPIAYDRSLKEAWLSYRTMDRGTVALGAISLLLIVGAAVVKFTNDL
jgi:hypothetical protein